MLKSIFTYWTVSTKVMLKDSFAIIKALIRRLRKQLTDKYKKRQKCKWEKNRYLYYFILNAPKESTESNLLWNVRSYLWQSPHSHTQRPNCNDLYSTLASVALSSGPITNSEGGSQWRLRVPLKKDTQKAVNSNELNAQISDCYFKELLSYVKVYCL